MPSNLFSFLSRNKRGKESDDDQSNKKQKNNVPRGGTKIEFENGLENGWSSSSSDDEDHHTKKEKKRLAPSKLMTITNQQEASAVIKNSSFDKNDSDESTAMEANARKPEETPPTDSDESQECTQPTSNTTKKRTRDESAPPAASVAAQQSDSLLSDSEQEENVPTIDLLKHQCWKCSAQFKLQDSNDFCLYAMHIHPLFKVPICSVCCDEVGAVELDSAKDNNATTECSGCGREEAHVETLFLCDDCPRAFCDTCVACAHGGGDEGAKQVHVLKKSNDKWFCPHCKPPPPLQSLQAHTERIGEEKERQQRTLDDVMLELDAVELERKECEERQSPQAVERKRKEIRAELCKSMAHTPMEEIDDAVEEEVEDWKQMWAKHDERLADRVLSLQEEIELRGENLAGCYVAIQGETAVDDVEPEWKKAADAEIEEREEKEEDEDDLSLQNPSDPSIYKLDIPEDVEDLGISDPGENQNKKSQWRHGRRRAKKEDMQEALNLEDEMLEQRNIPVMRVVDDTEDKEATKKEEELASGRGADGASRIRRDVYQVVVRRRGSRARARSRRPRGERPTKRQRVSSTVSNNDPQTELTAEDSVTGIAGIPSAGGNGVFDDPALILSSPDNATQLGVPASSVRNVSIAGPLASLLKTHQIAGVVFMWRNCFADLAFLEPPADVVERVGGCILAHNMGLGKSLTCIALLHAMLNHPNLESKASNIASPGLGVATRRNSRLIWTALLVVPTNVIAHWSEEFDQWTGHLSPSIPVHNLATISTGSRQKTVISWTRNGGVLVVSSTLFAQLVKFDFYRKALHDPGPDVVVVDEAHTMLTNTDNMIFKALSGVRTSRRIALTGSPIQNNLFEYFRMVNWVRPGILGSSKAKFDRKYAQPIMTGLASDASQFAVRESDNASRDLHNVLAPYVQRKDAKVLRKDLPPLQQVILHVRQTKTQMHLYRAFKRYRKRVGLTNFFTSYQMIRPLHNHPATLLMSSGSNGSEKKNTEASTPTPEEPVQCAPVENIVDASSKNETGRLEIELSTDSEEENSNRKPADAASFDEIRSNDDSPVLTDNANPAVSVDSEGNGSVKAATEAECVVSVKSSAAAASLPPSGRTKSQDAKEEEWWRKTVERHGGVDKLKDVEQGYKVVLLLHILVEAQALGDKVLVFSQCLKTLDFIEYVLGLSDWSEHVSSLTSASSGGKCGAWKNGIDYLRIDGQTVFSERGELIARFNNGDKNSSTQARKADGGDKVKAFLLSAKACGIGINLIAANRVVLFDNHFNPTVLTQALYRCYRYGQTKPVFAYRFMTEGSVEEKIYSRSVNKTGVALRVIDNKSITRSFTTKELRDLEETDAWVQCDRCEKWRMLSSNAESEQLPDRWFCELNTDDCVNNTCDASEKDARWYYRHLSEQRDILEESPAKCIAREAVDSALSQEEKAKLVDNDEILKKLLKVAASEQQSSVISKHYFHEALLAETEAQPVGESSAQVVEQPPEEGSQTKMPAKGPVKQQPARESLIESTDKAYAIADKKDATIGEIVRSVEAEYDVEFEKATKAIVRHRVKELLKDTTMGPTKTVATSEEGGVPSASTAKLSSTDASPSSSTAPTVDESLKLDSSSDDKTSLPVTVQERDASEMNSKPKPREKGFSTPEKKTTSDANNNEAPDELSTSSPGRSSSRSVIVRSPSLSDGDDSSSADLKVPSSPVRRSPSSGAPREERFRMPKKNLSLDGKSSEAIDDTSTASSSGRSSSRSVARSPSLSDDDVGDSSPTDLEAPPLPARQPSPSSRTEREESFSTPEKNEPLDAKSSEATDDISTSSSHSSASVARAPSFLDSGDSPSTALEASPGSPARKPSPSSEVRLLSSPKAAKSRGEGDHSSTEDVNSGEGQSAQKKTRTSTDGPTSQSSATRSSLQSKTPEVIELLSDSSDQEESQDIIEILD